jgi:MFS family permease
MFLVLAIWAKELTGSNAAAGMVFFVLVTPALLGPVAGLYVDRLRRRPVMIATDCAIGLVVLSLLFVRGESQLWLIYVVAFLYGAADAVFASAQSALLTVILPVDLLPEANGALQTVREGLRLVAPLAGAGLFVVAGGGAVAVVDAATFGVSAACLAAMRVKETKPQRSEHHWWHDVTAGVRHVVRTLPLRQIVVAVALALLVVGFSETAIFAVIDQGLHRPPSFFGVLGAVQGIGAVAGGLSSARVLRRTSDAWLVGVGIALFAVGDATFLTSSLPLVMVGIAVAGVGIAWVVVGFATAIQLRSPARLQGRVYSAADTMVGIPQTISIALGAALSTVVDYRVLVIAMAVVTAIAGIYLISRRVPRTARSGDVGLGAPVESESPVRL